MTAYVIIELDGFDRGVADELLPKTPAVIEALGGRYLVRLVRGEGGELKEGSKPIGDHLVVIEFADLDAARSFYNSTAYEPAKEARQKASRHSRVIIADGYRGVTS